jgi:hypothetical protein
MKTVMQMAAMASGESKLRGLVVTNTGFTAAAASLASDYGIALRTVSDLLAASSKEELVLAQTSA